MQADPNADTAIQPQVTEPAEAAPAVEAVRPEPVGVPAEPVAQDAPQEAAANAAWSVPAEAGTPQQDPFPQPPFAPGYVVPPAPKESAVSRLLRKPWAHVLGAGIIGGLIGGVIMAGAVTLFDGDDTAGPARVSRFDDQGGQGGQSGFPFGGQGGQSRQGGQGGGWQLPGQDGTQQDGTQQDGTQQEDLPQGDTQESSGSAITGGLQGA
ncbi:hypothetical protein EDD29_7160 [Actinocorallia herbida]|uniref:Uncharacterized protein n=1 Tax=Actinocorallia herbida TaxID=58109 RepID=A0A3N1D7H3_9ACTN|nr:hypothetical protein EDD29_7160 [Actinocorallia herbida]